MRALVVYESMFGNSGKVARAIADGLRAARVDVELVNAADAAAPYGDLVELLVVGGPTHAFSMTRHNTRDDAVRQGGSAGAAGSGIREWIEHLHKGPHSEMVATFDTRVDKVRHLPGSAAKSAAKALRKVGYRTLVASESFYVDDVAGPLLDGEEERARAWGERLGVSAVSRAPA
jgi:flavodoxin